LTTLSESFARVNTASTSDIARVVFVYACEVTSAASTEQIVSSDGGERDRELPASRRQPAQRRSRERVRQILKAAAELLAEGGVDVLTMRSLAERTGIPASTIYRYFDNRDAVIGAYLDDQLEQIGKSALTALAKLDTVTFRSMIEAVAVAHMRHHQTHPEGVPAWFGGRMNAAVVDRVRALDTQMAMSLRAALRETGMAAGAPEFTTDMVVRLFDRMFEFVFVSERTVEEQEEIVLTFIDMIATHMERFATPTGLRGISAKELVSALSVPR
jgi:AcrR family transcriptional regulator